MQRALQARRLAKWGLLRCFLAAVLVLSLVALFVFVLSGDWFVMSPTHGGRLALEARCAGIIEWLDQQYREKGRYPPALPWRLQRRLNWCLPRGRYRAEGGGLAFSIVIGDYSMPYLYAYTYSSKTRSWELDD